MNRSELTNNINLERNKGNKYYVYMLCFSDTMNPYYVGKGSNDRIFRHFNKAKNGCKGTLFNYIRKFGASIIIDSFYNKEENAFLREIELISIFGRKNVGKGSLVNLTDGGEGNSGVFVSESTRKLLSQRARDMWANSDFKKKTSKLISESLTKETQEIRLKSYQKYLDNPEWRRKFSEIVKNFQQSPEYRKKLSDSIKESWTKDRRANYSVKMKEIFDSKRKNSLIGGNRQAWKDTDKKEKRINNIKKAFSNNVWKEKQSENTKRSWQDDKIRNKRLANHSKAVHSDAYKIKKANEAKILWAKRREIVSECKSLIEMTSISIDLPKLNSSLDVLERFRNHLKDIILAPDSSNVISKSFEFREHPNSKAEGNPEPRSEMTRCNDYPEMEYTQVSGSGGCPSGMMI